MYFVPNSAPKSPLNEEEDIPCKISLCHEDKDFPFHTCFREDPVTDDGWIGEEVFTWVGLDRQNIKRVLKQQGKYVKLYINDDGDIVSQIIVERLSKC